MTFFLGLFAVAGVVGATAAGLGLAVSRGAVRRALAFGASAAYALLTVAVSLVGGGLSAASLLYDAPGRPLAPAWFLGGLALLALSGLPMAIVVLRGGWRLVRGGRDGGRSRLAILWGALHAAGAVALGIGLVVADGFATNASWVGIVLALYAAVGMVTSGAIAWTPLEPA